MYSSKKLNALNLVLRVRSPASPNTKPIALEASAYGSAIGKIKTLPIGHVSAS